MVTSIGGAILMAGVTLIGVQPALAANPDGSVSLVAATGKCIEVAPTPWGDYNVAGNRIQQRTCDDSPQQHWFLIKVAQNNGFSSSSTGAAPRSGAVISSGPLYHIINERTMQCLDDMNGGTANRNPVQQWPCNDSDTMRWELDSVFHPSNLGFVVINARAGKCLDVSDGSLQDYALLQIYNCFDSGNVAQHYTIQ